MTDYFSLARGRLPLRQVAEHYGVQFDRSGFARCPFHAERTGSFTVRRSASGREYFRCFGCGLHGDQFDFVGLYYSTQDKSEQLRRLNYDFSLGFDLDRRSTPKERAAQRTAAREREHRQAVQESFTDWLDNACLAVLAYVRTLRRWAVELAPGEPGRGVHGLYAYAMQQMSRAEELARIFTEGNAAELVAVYGDNRGEVMQIVEFVSGYEAEL